jgi:biopolymer transport protein TolR
MTGPNSSSSQNGMIVGINVTPLVDITLVLLIIFIVTAKLVVTPAVPMDLPRAIQSEAVQTVFSVVVPLRKPIVVNGQSIDGDETLPASARAAVHADKDVRAVIQADGDVSHRRVIHVLDVLKSAGINKIAFGALPEEVKGP